MPVLEFVILALALAVSLNIIAKALGLPTIIGYIATGLCLRYFYNVTQNEDLSQIAEFGLVFLLFTIGLEFSFNTLMNMKRAFFLNGTLQIILTGLILTILVKYAFNLNENLSFIIGLSLALSSTAIVLKILNDNTEIKKKYGQNSLAILIFQDLAVVPLFLMIDFYDQRADDMTSLLITTLFSALALLLLLFIISKYIFGAILHFVIKSNSDEIFISCILFTVIGASALAHYFGFSYSLGAFVAGVLLAKTRYKPKIENELIPFRDLLLGLFFISIGLQIDIEIVGLHWFSICVLVISVMLIKFLVILAILISYAGKRVAIKTAFALCQIGEFAIAVIALIQSKQFLDPQSSQILIATAIISMIITPFIMKNIQRLADVSLGDEKFEEDLKAKDLKGHFVIIGYGPTGQELVMRLRHKGLPYIVLESDLNLVDLGKVRGENVRFANGANSLNLKAANVQRSCAVILTLSNEEKLRLVMQSLENFKDIQVVVRTYKKLKELGVNSKHLHLIRPEESLAKDLFQEGLKCKLELENL